MEYSTLGSTGLRVSRLCLGSMIYGDRTEESTGHRMLDSFVEAGGNFVDTADVYGRGTSEEVVGRWLQKRNRDDIVVATKVFGRMAAGPNDDGLSRKHIMQAVDASLRRLGTDYIDLYQVHAWDDVTPIAETLSTLHDLVRLGKVRYLGVSNFAGWQLQKALDLADLRGWERFVCLQPLYNLIDREAEWELMPVAREVGLGVIPWSPLRQGWLGGRYHRGMAAPPAGSRVAHDVEGGISANWTDVANERTWGLLDELDLVAKEAEATVSQVSLRWLLQQPAVTAPIIGPRTPEQLDDALGALDLTLSTEQMDRLTSASTPENVPYPYRLWPRLSRR